MNIKLALRATVGILLAVVILACVAILIDTPHRLRVAAQQRDAKADLPSEAVILRLSPDKLVRLCGQPVSTNPPYGSSDWTEVRYGNYIFRFDRGMFMAVEHVLLYPEGFKGAKWYADAINDLPCLKLK